MPRASSSVTAAHGDDGNEESEDVQEHVPSDQQVLAPPAGEKQLTGWQRIFVMLASQHLGTVDAGLLMRLGVQTCAADPCLSNSRVKTYAVRNGQAGANPCQALMHEIAPAT